MKIVIDIPEEEYNEIEPFLNGETIKGGFNLFRVLKIIKNGTPLPDGAEILTKEAYSDLCTKAADVPNFESEEYIEKRLENYDKLLKSEMLDCVKDKAEPCDDVPDINAGELISRQAVLETLDDMDNILDEDRTVENYKELLTACYEVLPSVTPQPEKRTETHACDCISRQAATHYLTKARLLGDSRPMKEIFAEIPSVEPERKNDSMTVDDYRDRMIEAFHNADCDELISLIILPSEKEFEHLEWLLKNHYHHSVPERKPGKWVDGKCNRCGTNAPFWPMSTTYYCSEYCPKCGCRMKGGTT